jgi:hypothetical protein
MTNLKTLASGILRIFLPVLLAVILVTLIAGQSAKPNAAYPGPAGTQPTQGSAYPGPVGTQVINASSVGKISTARASGAIPPTAAPSKTPGAAPTDMPLVLLTLVGGPLVTAEQVLAMALRIDHETSRWEKPWTLDTPKTDPSRITIKAFPSQTAADGGNQDEFAPGHDEAIGPVWRVTIKGHVHIETLTMRVDDATAVYDGVTYTIAQNSGALVGVDGGPLIPGAAITPPPPPTNLPQATPYP